jgi:hypothetical protein
MAFNVSTFKRQMTGDGARPNLFKVSITGATNYWTLDSVNDHFFIRASSIPGATMGTVVTPYFGREVKFAGNRTFADWTVTVLNDENFKVRARLEEWMMKINSHEGNQRITTGAINGYFGTATVQQLGKNASNVLRNYTFQNIFPVDLSEITLDWGDNDSIEEFTCTFTFDYWESKPGTATGISAVNIT